MDPILRLRNKLEDIKKAKETIDKELEKDDAARKVLSDRIAVAEKENKAKTDRKNENEAKLKRVENLIGESEKSLRRIIETSLALEKVLEQEGCGN